MRPLVVLTWQKLGSENPLKFEQDSGGCIKVGWYSYFAQRQPRKCCSRRGRRQ